MARVRPETVAWGAFAALLGYVAVENLFAPFGGTVATLAYELALVCAGLSCAVRALRRPSERLAWSFVAAGLFSWAAGDAHWSFVLADLEEQPYPSLADALYLGFYPAVYVGLGLLARSRLGSFPRAVWLDGLIGALAVAAVGTGLVLPPVLATTGGETLAVATNLAYPLADAVLVGFVAAVAVMARDRLGPAWLLVAGGLAVFGVADSLYLYQVAVGSYELDTLLDLGWVAGPALLAVAAWAPDRRHPPARMEGLSVVWVPASFTLVALGVLVYDHFSRVTVVTLVLAASAILLVVGRLVLTFAEHVRMLRHSEREALTDALTGLPNRRALVEDLDAALVEAQTGRAHVLALFDLDGFKAYNDAFGHLAGDALLQRLSGRLAAVVRPPARAYRLGGDEFCVLAAVESRERGDALVDAAADALVERGERFSVRASHGTAFLPDEAGDASSALRLADTRMYAHKAHRPADFRHVRAALLSALDEHDRIARSHAVLAESVGRRLGLQGPELEELRTAAELHDLGKLGIPEEILAKPGPLTEEEWAFVRQHTVIGQRMVSSTPSLARVAAIVRSAHERWDGDGYPDKLAGDSIPLASRIIFVCDAFEAMTSAARAYRAPLDPGEALEELRRCAGTQFDPAVVDQFVAALAAAAGDEPAQAA